MFSICLSEHLIINLIMVLVQNLTLYKYCNAIFNGWSTFGTKHCPDTVDDSSKHLSFLGTVFYLVSPKMSYHKPGLFPKLSLWLLYCQTPHSTCITPLYQRASSKLSAKSRSSATCHQAASSSLLQGTDSSRIHSETGNKPSPWDLNVKGGQI